MTKWHFLYVRHQLLHKCQLSWSPQLQGGGCVELPLSSLLTPHLEPHWWHSAPTPCREMLSSSSWQRPPGLGDRQVCHIESEQESPLLPHHAESRDTRPLNSQYNGFSCFKVISQDQGLQLEWEEVWSNSLFKTNDCHTTQGRDSCFLIFHILTYILKKFTQGMVYERAQEAPGWRCHI